MNHSSHGLYLKVYSESNEPLGLVPGDPRIGNNNSHLLSVIKNNLNTNSNYTEQNAIGLFSRKVFNLFTLDEIKLIHDFNFIKQQEPSQKKSEGGGRRRRYLLTFKQKHKKSRKTDNNHHHHVVVSRKRIKNPCISKKN